jgi:deoxyribodipyrimidine photo-lyase
MVKVFWFRKDLRINDNRALYHFINSIGPEDKFIFLYIKDNNNSNHFGEKRISFLYESLKYLQKTLEVNNFNLYIYNGNSIDCIKFIVSKFGPIELFSNKQIEPYSISRDTEIREFLNSKKSDLNQFSDSTLFQPGEVLKEDKTPYTIFTPFRKKCELLLNKSHYTKSESDISVLNPRNNIFLQNSFDYTKEYLNLEKSPIFRGGRDEGIRLLGEFMVNGITDYHTYRNYPYKNGTSRISPHIHFGTISIREIYRNTIEKSDITPEKTGINTWVNELFWREFYNNITYHFPKVVKTSFKEKYDKVRWNTNLSLFNYWREGRTGFPIVDAGMRQLKEEGWMHNRVRMITAMFLTKDLLIDWRLGEKHFAENLVDFDFSSNNGGWQWCASTGCDAQPYFRIFNPYLQSRKFDAEGDYIRKYVKELRKVPSKLIHKPDDMSSEEQQRFGAKIGKDYPMPVVNHQLSKEYAITQFSNISKEI